MTRASGKR